MFVTGVFGYSTKYGRCEKTNKYIDGLTHNFGFTVVESSWNETVYVAPIPMRPKEFCSKLISSI